MTDELVRLIKKDLLKQGRESVYNKEKKAISVGEIKYSRGATRLLRNIFYANEKKSLLRRRSANSSSRYQGKAVHRAIYHRYMCDEVMERLKRKQTASQLKKQPAKQIKKQTTQDGSDECYCLVKFKDETSKPPPPINPKHLMGRKLTALTNWLDKKGIRIIACECPVGWPDANAATYLDAVCVYVDEPDKFFVLEFKTGYPPSKRTEAATTDKSLTMIGAGGRLLKNNTLNKHMLQLWFGIQAFKKTYSVTPTDGAVIYFQQQVRRVSELTEKGIEKKTVKLWACCGYLYSDWINDDMCSKLETQITVGKR